jgi:hypothetical protein
MKICFSGLLGPEQDKNGREAGGRERPYGESKREGEAKYGRLLRQVRVMDIPGAAESSWSAAQNLVPSSGAEFPQHAE